MSEIVKYHNDFNKIQLPSFTEQEQNLFLFYIFARIKEKGIDNVINLYANDFKINEKLSNSREYLTENINSLKYKFFKANFKQIIETKTEVIHKYVNLFETMEIHYVKRNPDDGYDESTLFNRITLKINPDFAYLVNQLTTNYSFELEEFIALSGKYAKTLYRLLKQFRTTGKAYFEWDEFCKVMDIPQDYRQSEVDKWILNLLSKNFLKNSNLFDQIRVPFKNLAYEKEKTAGVGVAAKFQALALLLNLKISKCKS
nr:repB [gfp marker plasmid pWM1001]AAG34034.1 repB [gfp marker plasmid pWM1007]AAG34038.1 repB [yfp marker plasmid pWM1008]AAG34042.1 repB [cfp marker plasmid pWM1009]AAG34046.1 repB [yfp marker plasmid pWM1011]AAG34050.1 repB [cfp marker plasmid pWM1012]